MRWCPSFSLILLARSLTGSMDSWRLEAPSTLDCWNHCLAGVNMRSVKPTYGVTASLILSDASSVCTEQQS